MPSLVEKVMPYIVSIVLGAAAIGKLDELRIWILKAQVRALRDSRTSNWVSPRIFPDRDFTRKK
jgi:hypothetical protein